MKKRWSIFLVGALMASVMAAPAAAEVVPTVPEEPNIVDDADDANGGTGAPGSLSRADILKVWFTEEEDWILTHIQTSAAGTDPNPYLYRVWIDAGAGECLQIRGFSAGATKTTPFSATGSLRQTCDGDTTTSGEFLQVVGPEETGIRTIALPREAHEAFQPGTTLIPRAEVTNYTVAVTAPQIDGTDVGTPYEVTGGDSGQDDPNEPGPGPAEPKDPPKKDEKKNCNKIKNKKKKKKCKKNENKGKKAEPKVCETWTPGEMGAEAGDPIVVEDENTEEVPLETTVAAEPGLKLGLPTDETTGGDTFVNLQVDTANESAGLWVRLEFSRGPDYDLFLHDAEGNEVANAHGFNPTHPTFSGENNGGESGNDYEMLTGVKTDDCGGYTLDVSTAHGTGGDLTLKLWLGDEVHDPSAEEAQAAVKGFFSG